jgi:hypothetical protein
MVSEQIAENFIAGSLIGDNGNFQENGDRKPAGRTPQASGFFASTPSVHIGDTWPA